VSGAYLLLLFYVVHSLGLAGVTRVGGPNLLIIFQGSPRDNWNHPAVLLYFSFFL